MTAKINGYTLRLKLTIKFRIISKTSCMMTNRIESLPDGSEAWPTASGETPPLSGEIVPP